MNITYNNSKNEVHYGSLNEWQPANLANAYTRILNKNSQKNRKTRKTRKARKTRKSTRKSGRKSRK